MPISARVKNEKEVKEGEKVLRSERYLARFARFLPWPGGGRNGNRS